MSQPVSADAKRLLAEWERIEAIADLEERHAAMRAYAQQIWAVYGKGKKA